MNSNKVKARQLDLTTSSRIMHLTKHALQVLPSIVEDADSVRSIRTFVTATFKLLKYVIKGYLTLVLLSVHMLLVLQLLVCSGLLATWLFILSLPFTLLYPLIFSNKTTSPIQAHSYKTSLTSPRQLDQAMTAENMHQSSSNLQSTRSADHPSEINLNRRSSLPTSISASSPPSPLTPHTQTPHLRQPRPPGDTTPLTKAHHTLLHCFLTNSSEDINPTERTQERDALQPPDRKKARFSLGEFKPDPEPVLRHTAFAPVDTRSCFSS
jgi:hypothetical protein